MLLEKNTLLESVIRYSNREKIYLLLTLMFRLLVLVFVIIFPLCYQKIVNKYIKNMKKNKFVLEDSYFYKNFAGEKISFNDSVNFFTFCLYIPKENILNIEVFNSKIQKIQNVVEETKDNFLIRGFIKKSSAEKVVQKLIDYKTIKDESYSIKDPLVVISE